MYTDNLFYAMGMSADEFISPFTLNTNGHLFFTSGVIPAKMLAGLIHRALQSGVRGFIMPTRSLTLLSRDVLGESAILFFEKASIKLSGSSETLPLLFFFLQDTDVIPMMM